MTEQQIIKEVIRYINDTAYNYAVLIDGEWGCGKTYFIQNVLSDAITESEKKAGEARKVVYISLYGCKSVQDVQENLAWCLVGDLLEKMKNKANRKFFIKIKEWKVWHKVFRGKRQRNGENTGKRLYLSSRKIGSAIAKMHFPNVSAYDVMSDWIKLNSYIFVFDDLERCDCPLNEIFGYLNGLVEHEGTKLIIVANEREIAGGRSSTNLEKQYEVILDDRIQWPKYEPPYSFGQEKKGDKLGLDELEERRNWLFPNISEGEYERIREKLIGVTLKFEPDIRNTMSQMIEKSDMNQAVQELLKMNLDSFFSVMNRYEHYNLRTFQFFLSKINYLLQKLDEVYIGNEYVARMKSSLIQECFRCAVMFKANIKLPKDEKDRILYEDEFHLNTVKAYVEKGEFVAEKFELDINQYIEEEFRDKISSDDPYTELSNGYYLHTQDWCEKKLEEITKRMDDNVYPLWAYERIITCVVRLVELGFSEHYLNRIKESMLKNITQMKHIQKLEADFFFTGEENIKQRVQAVIAEINEAVTDYEQMYRRSSMNKILKEEQWVERLKRDINPKEHRYAMEKSIFSQTDANVWIERLKSSSPSEIMEFRRWLNECYPSSKLKGAAKEDIPVLQEIVSSLRQIEEEDLIKKAGLLWTAKQVEELIAPYCLVEDKVHRTKHDY